MRFQANSDDTLFATKNMARETAEENKIFNLSQSTLGYRTRVAIVTLVKMTASGPLDSKGFLLIVQSSRHSMPS